MKKIIPLVTTLIITLVAVAFIMKWNAGKELTIQNVIKEANAERKKSLLAESSADITQFSYTVSGDKEGFTDEEIKMLLERRPQKSGTISTEEALEDTAYLFKIFKYVYGGYGLYGGDEVFDEVESQVLTEIKSTDQLTVQRLTALYAKHLSFISDGHLNIGGININKDFIMNYYCNQDLEIHKDSKGYYFLDDAQRKDLISINKDTDLDNYLKLSINEEGDLVYYIGLLQNNKNAIYSIPAQWTANSQTTEMIVKVKQVLPKTHGRNLSTFEQQTVDGVPLLKLIRMDDLPEENTLKGFVESASILKKEPLLIIDISKMDPIDWTLKKVPKFIGSFCIIIMR